MSQNDNHDPEKGNAIDGQSSRHPSAQIQLPQGMINSDDSSGPLFRIYSNIAEGEDDKMVERWQKDAEGIIIFTGLFSAVIVTLVAVSLQDLRPNSQDVSAFYLEKMYQLQADPNASLPPVPSAVASPLAFSPPRYAVWVNSLWFLSLVISLSCAMLATSLQQWARRYIRITQPPRCSPHKRARARAFFANDVEKLHVSWTVEVLPALVHLSLFVFFVGLLVYLFNVNHTVFNVAICWVALLSTLYGFITFLPIFRHDSPYCSPLSSIAWSFQATVRYAVLKLFEITTRTLFSQGVYDRVHGLGKRYRKLILGGVERAAGEAASERSSEIDGRILEWTAKALHGDDSDALETFIESIPGFYKSNIVKDIPESVNTQILLALSGLMYRAMTSNSVSGSVKVRWLAICFNAADQVSDPFGFWFLFTFLAYHDWREVPDAVMIGHFLRSWDKKTNGRFASLILGVISCIVASTRECDDRWAALAQDHLGIPEGVLQHYLTEGDSLLLANLICYSRHADRSGLFSMVVLRRTLSKLDIHNTLPELQQHFCALFNELFQETRNDDSDMSGYSVLYLEELLPHFIALHPGIDAVLTTSSESVADAHVINGQPSSFPLVLCNVPSHRSHQIHHPHNVPVVEAHPPAPALVLSTEVAPRDSTLSSLSSITSSSELSPSAHADDITTHPADEPLLHIPHAPIVRSSHPGSQVPGTRPSPDPPTDSAASTSIQTTTFHPAISSAMTSDLDHSTPAATTSIQQLNIPPPSTSSTIATVSLSPSIVPVVSFSSSPYPVSGDMATVDSVTVSTSSSSRSDHALPGQEGPPPSSVNAVPPFVLRTTSENDPTIVIHASTNDSPDSSHGRGDS